MEQTKEIKCYCINCKKEIEMVVTNEVLLYNSTEKKILGYCKGCCEQMCRIIYFSNDSNFFPSK